jgi:hypothetical protein
MASDHGHVRADLMRSVAASERGGNRWRPWSGPGDEVAEYEVVFPGTEARDAWLPRGASGVVLLADEQHRYGGSVFSGEHGGATLSEVVAPCVLIGCEDTVGAQDDVGQAVAAAYVPGWWYFDVPRPVIPAAPAAVAPAAAEADADRPRPGQLALPQLEPARASVAVTRAEADMDSAFARSAMLEARAPTVSARKQVVMAVEFLLSRSGVASAEAFASRMSVPVYRVGGLVSHLQEVLNVDGYQVVRFDHAGGQVHLDRAKLEQQFEVKL